ncbi:MAG TPA: UbiA family prenyltransferase [Gemmatimonadales bacterium]|nr:UbiA family prenyltransferase [Gemmatimonadales bacterium]
MLHTRPIEWPIVAAHTAVGYLLAVGVSGALLGQRVGPAVLGVLLWVIALNGGTLALNSAYDRDEGDIAYLRRPPPAPPHLAAFGLMLMTAGAAAALTLPRRYLAVYLLCFVLSVLYSVPPFRLKAVAGVDLLINMWGFGTLTPYAGWAATDLPVGPVGRMILLGFCPLFAALYPLTQIYQIEEDTARGDRTLAIILGVPASLWLSLLGATAAFALFGFAAVRAGWSAGDRWRWLVLVLAALAWVVVLLPWLRRHRRMNPQQHQHGMYRALLAWAITDVAVVLAWAT